uniref:PIH1 domain containing 1 n=1 Tax=Ovis aries TaxID=9940 RepID=A0AC11DQZ2_SHEEP
MADSKLLVPELNDAETMGAETSRFQELLLQASKELQQAQTSRPESTQIQPQPGFCIKTNSAEGKVFINICHSPFIPPPADLTEDELLQMLEEDQAGFRIPMSLGEPHAELDAKGQGCTAYDVAVNSDFFRRMQNSDFLRELVITIAREGLEDKYGLQLNPEWRILKNRPFLGSISQQNIRSQQRPRIQELGNLYTPSSPRPEAGWAFDGAPISCLPNILCNISLHTSGRGPGALGTQKEAKWNFTWEGVLRPQGWEGARGNSPGQALAALLNSGSCSSPALRSLT